MSKIIPGRVLLPLLFIVFLMQSCIKNTAYSEPADGAVALSLQNANTTTVAATAVCDYVVNEAGILAAGYTKVFEDDFNADLGKWNIWVGGAFNNELQYYQAANMQLANGNLVITAKKETVTGRTSPFDTKPKTFNYTSGRVECKSNISASATTPRVRIVARIKLPAGNGMWSAFWSYGDPWPTQGEIDYLEARGQEPFKYETNYFYGKARNRNLVKNQVGFITTSASLTDCYHVYEMIWSQNSLTSLLDGNVVETKTGSYIPNLFGKVERIVLNLSVGGNFFTNLNPAQIVTGSMYVDYVKVFIGN
jgi:beta-glucanase (GH16 family)